MARKMLADSEAGVLIDLSSAHICLDCLGTLRYLNENQYYMCQHLLPGASIKRPRANQALRLLLQPFTEPQGCPNWPRLIREELNL